MTLSEAIARAVEIANRAGLNGRRVTVAIIPPTTGTGDYAFAVADLPHRRTGSEPD